MLILTTFSALCMDRPDHAEDLNIEEIKKQLMESYNEAAARESDTFDAPYCTDVLDITFGMQEPDNIINVASEWNNNIVEDFRGALLEVLGTSDVTTASIPTDTTATYDLLKKTHQLDNSWHPLAYYSVMTEPCSFNHILSDYDKGYATAAPENWILAELIIHD